MNIFKKKKKEHKPHIVFLGKNLKVRDQVIFIRDDSNSLFCDNMWLKVNEYVESICCGKSKEKIKRRLAELDMPYGYRQMIFDKCKVELKLIKERADEYDKRISDNIKRLK